jgi:endo-1,4-beta-D-glucanase Y
MLERPFPQHIVYAKQTIKPSNHSQKELDNAVETFYDKWKQAYVRNNCSDKQQYYVLDDEDMEPGDKFHSICVSEGQGYGMLIMVMMAGYDKQAQTIFDGMYRFYKAHPSERSEYMMSWSILNNCETNKKDGNQSSASDGDFDIALSLLMAGVQWGNNGTIHYKEEAIKLITAIKELEINPKKNTILMSNDNHPEVYEKDMKYYESHPSDYDYNDIRSSDFMPVHLRVFNKYVPQKSWMMVMNKTYKIFEDLQQEYSPKANLIPDFIVFRDKKYQPAPINYLESKYDGSYYYNACRVPMRLALDKLLYGNKQADSILTPINEWIQKKTGNSIDKINCGYSLNGQRLDREINTIPSFVCPLAVSAMINTENQDWLNDMWDFIATEFEFKDYQYYDNSIQMLSLLTLSGNTWVP